MKVEFPLFRWLYKTLRNFIILLAVVFIVQYVIAGSSITVRYRDIPLHRYKQEQVKHDWWSKAVKGLEYAKQARELWPL